jgi:C4-dicarboxylate-specific signal transduction histidine kinase
LTASSNSLALLLAVAEATLSERAELIEANAGFLRLVHLAQVPPATIKVARFFIQPDFEALRNAQPDCEGLVYQGLLTFGDYAQQPCTLLARVWRVGERLRVLAEHDIEDLERLNTTVLSLNRDYTRTQLELAQANLKLQATNTRLMDTQKKLVEAEKMASMGILVAGVAHEINTPLGVSLAAVSDLQEKSAQLAERFAERNMTQVDLTNYLERSTERSSLIRRNLERIGRLIDSFRQVAVGAKPLESKPFDLRDCLDNAVRSFGDRLSSGGVRAHIDCTTKLVVTGNQQEWATVFTNLIDNSLKHAFKGRMQGRIDFQVEQSAKGLKLMYRDDGLGMTPQVLARIFDPFFTTDLQVGMGLGMHLVYNLVTHRFGGRIRCESTPGTGVQIEIEVPS